MGKQWKQWDFIFWGSKITEDGDCSHKIKTLTPWNKSYDQPRQHITKWRHYIADKGPSSQSYDFSVVTYGCEICTIKKASLSITNSQSLLKLMSIESVMLSSHFILCCPLSPPAPNPSKHQGLFQWVSSSHEVAKVLELQLQHQSLQWTPRTDLL